LIALPLDSEPTKGESDVTDPPPEGQAETTWERLRRRKVVQWGIAYAAGAWGLLQGIAYMRDTFGWPHQLQQLATVALLIGLPIAVTLAWYHGDKGQQRITRAEFAILTLLFLLGGGLFWRYEHATGPAPAGGAAESGPSVAVLPFENRSDERKDAYFVDGIHDDILTQLSKVSALKVISRTSVEQFRDTKLPIREIAAELGVRSILEGGVQRGGNRVRINVQLIDAATDSHLWAETYDRELTASNIFAIQSEVAAAIASALKAALTPAEQARVKAVPTQNLKAWEAYQLGQQRMARRTSKGVLEAEKFFHQAIELDPKFAPAYAALAASLMLQVEYAGAPMEPTLLKAQEATDTALRLDPGLADAWAVAGLIAFFRNQYADAEPLYARALELNPNYSMAAMWYGFTLRIDGRLNEGRSWLEKAASLDPLLPIVQTNLGEVLAQQGDLAGAEARYRRAIEIDPSFSTGYSHIGEVLAYGQNRFADGVSFSRKAVEIDPDTPEGFASLGRILVDLGDESFVKANGGADARWPENFLVQLWIAMVYLFQQQGDSALRHAEILAEYGPPLGRRWGLMLLRDADLSRQNVEQAVDRYEKAFPQFFVQGTPTVNDSTFAPAIDLALVLQRHGDVARAKLLIDGAEQAIRPMPRLGGLFFGYGIADVQIHALRGDKTEALVALREAEQAGWRGPFWRYYRDFDPALGSIRNDPEFKAVFADIERDMARQRAELAARPKDAPPPLEATSR
jgi:TolB-like protein/Tfp pilus assembly protein PilF